MMSLPACRWLDAVTNVSDGLVVQRVGFP
jgi:hypothetical protein